jgi:hypothetical protein
MGEGGIVVGDNDQKSRRCDLVLDGLEEIGLIEESCSLAWV